MRNLTERQQRILEFFEEFLDERSYPPTVRDIQRGCDISSTSVVSYNIEILKREGLIRKDDGVSRGLGLVAPRQQRNAQETVAVPLVGSIAAGEPFPLPTAETWASAADLDTVDLPQPIAGRSEGLYALNVKGESMIDALIADGDLVIMQQTNSVPNGRWPQCASRRTMRRRSSGSTQRARSCGCNPRTARWSQSSYRPTRSMC